VSEPFLGEIRTFGFNFAPQGWALCDGQLLAISQNTALFSLLGTQYGGNGTTNFALPNLQSRVGIHMGGGGAGLSAYTIGQVGGSESVVLTTPQLPSHNHPANASAAEFTTTQPGGHVPAAGGDYAAAPDGATTLNAQTIGPTGGGLGHPNIQPYLCLNFCIALTGIFPARN
jgi:microcystin-dependent protein